MKREGPTSTAARPPQRVGSAGRFAGPDRIPARCAAFAPAPRPRSGVRGFGRHLPNQKDQEQDHGTDNRTAHRRSQDPDLRRQARPAAGPRRSPVRRSPQSQQQCDRIRSASALLRRGGRDPHHHRGPPPHQERHRQQAQGNGDSRQTGRSARRHARRRRKRRARADLAHRSLAVDRRSRLEELDGGSNRDSLRRAAPTGPQAPAPWKHPSRDARAHGPRRHARGAIPPHDRLRASLRTGRRLDEAEAEEGPDGLLVRDRQFSREAPDVRPRREVRGERAGRLRHRLDRRPLRPGRRGQPLHDRRRRLSRRAARLARSQRSEERGNRSGRRIRRCPAPEGRDPGLGRQARQTGPRRALRRPAKRGGQRGLFHAACPRCEGVEDRRRRRRGCSGR